MLLGGVTQDCVAFTGWNRSEFSMTLPGARLDAEEENCAQAVRLAANHTNQAPK
jgi:hypothetical protein